MLIQQIVIYMKYIFLRDFLILTSIIRIGLNPKNPESIKNKTYITIILFLAYIKAILACRDERQITTTTHKAYQSNTCLCLTGIQQLTIYVEG